jgi:hypothetical protein
MRSQYKIYGLEWVGATEGAIIRFVVDDESGDIVGELLSRPADHAEQEEAGTPYALFLLGGLPNWRTVASAAVATGYGNNYGNDYGGPA